MCLVTDISVTISFDWVLKTEDIQFISKKSIFLFLLGGYFPEGVIIQFLKSSSNESEYPNQSEGIGRGS